jgi:hypothetical protein
MKRFGCMAAFVLILAACNNDQFRSVGNTGVPVTPTQPAPIQAPPPPTGSFQQPPLGQTPMNGYPGQFTPQVPPGQPPAQYYPFVPIDNYFRRTPGMLPDWNMIWNTWNQFAPMNGYNTYDFYNFWNVYFYQIAQMDYSGYYWSLFQYYNQNVYYWMQPGMSFSPADPTYFWQNYSGVPYYQLDSGYGYCGQCWN